MTSKALSISILLLLEGIPDATAIRSGSSSSVDQRSMLGLATEQQLQSSASQGQHLDLSSSQQLLQKADQQMLSMSLVDQ